MTHTAGFFAADLEYINPCFLLFFIGTLNEPATSLLVAHLNRAILALDTLLNDFVAIQVNVALLLALRKISTVIQFYSEHTPSFS